MCGSFSVIGMEWGMVPDSRKKRMSAGDDRFYHRLILPPVKLVGGKGLLLFDVPAGSEIVSVDSETDPPWTIIEVSSPAKSKKKQRVRMTQRKGQPPQFKIVDTA